MFFHSHQGRSASSDIDDLQFCVYDIAFAPHLLEEIAARNRQILNIIVQLVPRHPDFLCDDGRTRGQAVQDDPAIAVRHIVAIGIRGVEAVGVGKTLVGGCHLDLYASKSLLCHRIVLFKDKPALFRVSDDHRLAFAIG